MLRKTSGCEADICFSALLNEHASVGDRQGVRSTGMRVWKEEEHASDEVRQGVQSTGMRVWKEEESMRLSETDRECGAQACEYGKKKRASGCEAKETYGIKKSK